jgi:hypothetical protein
MTLRLLNAARFVAGLVAGAASAPAVRDPLHPAGSFPNPAHDSHPLAGRLAWLVDAAAAGQLQETVP